MTMEFLRDLTDFIFPRRCHICGVTLSGAPGSPSPEYLCPRCLAELPRTLYHRRHDNPMADRFAGIFPFERATGHFFYSPQSPLAQLIQDFKYRHFRQLACFLGSTMASELAITPFFSGIDLLVPIPMHFLKKARRGYNQTEEIVRGISRITSIPGADILKAARPHRTQTTLSHARRQENLRGVFRVTDSGAIAGRHILLVDDVCTTGATLTAAAESLLAARTDIRISMLTLGVTF